MLFDLYQTYSAEVVSEDRGDFVVCVTMKSTGSKFQWSWPFLSTFDVSCERVAQHLHDKGWPNWSDTGESINPVTYDLDISSCISSAIDAYKFNRSGRGLLSGVVS